MNVLTGLGVSLMLAVVAGCVGGVKEISDEVIKVDIATVSADGSVPVVAPILSAGQPDAAALQVFAKSGYVAVIDLRGVSEDRGIDEQAEVEALDMKYVTLPIVGDAAINFENAEKLDRIIAGFDAPVLVHCGSGNRVGALLALRHRLAGADDEAALELGKSAGLTSLEPVVRRRLTE